MSDHDTTRTGTGYVPVPDEADSVRDHAGRHGWDITCTWRPVRGRIVEHQITFTRGADTIVTFWPATVEGDDLGCHDFMVYRAADFKYRTGRTDQVVAFLSAPRSADTEAAA